MTNDFDSLEAWKDMILHQLHPEADLNAKTMLCAKCGASISLRESAPLSYYDEDEKNHSFYICMKCFADYVPKKEMCEREFIRRFLRGGRMSNLEKAKQIIKENFKAGDCGLFSSRNTAGDQMTTIYEEGGLQIDICYHRSYFEVFGLSDSEFGELLAYYNKGGR